MLSRAWPSLQLRIVRAMFTSSGEGCDLVHVKQQQLRRTSQVARFLKDRTLSSRLLVSFHLHLTDSLFFPRSRTPEYLEIALGMNQAQEWRGFTVIISTGGEKGAKWPSRSPAAKSVRMSPTQPPHPVFLVQGECLIFTQVVWGPDLLQNISNSTCVPRPRLFDLEKPSRSYYHPPSARTKGPEVEGIE